MMSCSLLLPGWDFQAITTRLFQEAIKALKEQAPEVPVGWVMAYMGHLYQELGFPVTHRGLAFCCEPLRNTGGYPMTSKGSVDFYRWQPSLVCGDVWCWVGTHDVEVGIINESKALSFGPLSTQVTTMGESVRAERPDISPWHHQATPPSSGYYPTMIQRMLDDLPSFQWLRSQALREHLESELTSPASPAPPRVRI